MRYRLLTEVQAAEFLALERCTLEKWRNRGRGPRYIRLEPRGKRPRIRYRSDWLEEFVNAGVVHPAEGREAA